MSEPMCEYLTSKDVAIRLGYSVRAIVHLFRAYHESGGTEGIPCFKFGRGQWRVERRALD